MVGKRRKVPFQRHRRNGSGRRRRRQMRDLRTFCPPWHGRCNYPFRVRVVWTRRVTTPKETGPPRWRPRSRVQQENVMLTTLATTGLLAQALPGGLIGIAVIFFSIAILAYVLGARGVAGMSAGIGRTLLFVFLVLAVIMVIVGLVNHVSHRAGVVLFEW